MSERRPTQASVRIPADVERPDRILAGLTARQLAIVSAALLIVWFAFEATRHFLPVGVFAVIATPIVVIAGLAAMAKVDGVSGDRLIAAIATQLRQPKRLVVAPEGVTPASEVIEPGAICSVETPAPLRLGIASIESSGVIDLGGNGTAMVAEAVCPTFSLRTIEEKEALISGFARFLNSLSDPIEIVVSSVPVDLKAQADSLSRSASSLNNANLQAAAIDHARFLGDLGDGGDIFVRRVLVVFRQAGGPASTLDTGRLARRVDEAASNLFAAGVSLSLLDGAEVTHALNFAADPLGSRLRPEATTTPTATVTGNGRARYSAPGAEGGRGSETEDL